MKPGRKLLARIVAESRDGFVVAEPRAGSWVVVYVNAAFERITGYRSADILGRDCRRLQGDERDQQAREDLRAALAAGRACDVVLRNFRKDGEAFWNHLTLIPIDESDGSVSMYVGQLRDATAEHEAKDRAQGGEEQLAAAKRRIADLVTHDKVTGISTRRYFEDRYQREWQRALRDSAPVTVMLFDIDHFDSYNETFGRQAGHSALRQIARAIDGALRRASDMSARYGGEEFVAFTRDMTAADAAEFGQAICDRVRRLAIHHPKSPTSRYLTLSAGVVTTVPAGRIESDALLAAVEVALVEAKKTGRNCVVAREAAADALAAGGHPAP